MCLWVGGHRFRTKSLSPKKYNFFVGFPLLTLRKIHIPQHRCLLLCSAHLSQLGTVPLLLLWEEELLGDVVTKKFLRLLVVKVVLAQGLTCYKQFYKLQNMGDPQNKIKVQTKLLTRKTLLLLLFMLQILRNV